MDGRAGRQAGGRSGTLVIQTAFLGDVVLTTPLLAALAERYGPVDVVTTPAAAVLLETHPAVGTVIRYDKRGADRGLRGLWTAGTAAPGTTLCAGLPAAPLLALGRAGAARRRGGADRLRRQPGGGDVHPAGPSAGDRARGGAAADAGARRMRAPARRAPAVHLALTADDRAAADAWLRERNVGAGFVALAPGSIWGTKRWAGYPELAAALDAPVVVLGGRDDAALADQVVAAAPGRAYSAAGTLGLRTSAALIARAGVLVTNDSAPLHLATAVGTPVVAIFGPTVPAFGFGPRGPRDVIVEHPSLACRPCSAHGPQVCPLGHHRCMRELSVASVLAAVAAASAVEAHGAIRTRH